MYWLYKSIANQWEKRGDLWKIWLWAPDLERYDGVMLPKVGCVKLFPCRFGWGSEREGRISVEGMQYVFG